MKRNFLPADILLPDFDKVNGKGWAVIACDQHTGEPEYWAEVEKEVSGAPSTLDLILPEVYLSESEQRIPKINATMSEYIKNVLVTHKNSMIYLERTQSDGCIRKGIVGMIDLEDYDYNKGAISLTRATEGTVLDRIPPRVAVRRGAEIELPHVMMLIDDPDKTVIEPEQLKKCDCRKAYDFDLMLGGGHVSAWFVDEAGQERIEAALNKLITPEEIKRKYGGEFEPLLFAVGDGNHSLASAKAAYEEAKAHLGDAALESPLRYALAEIVNLHDDALKFEPIYRVMFGVNPEDVMEELIAYAETLDGESEPQEVSCISATGEGSVLFARPLQQLTVGTLQDFIDGYIKAHEGVSVDYIHGVEATKALACGKNAIGFLFDGISKDSLFKTVMCDGALPRKAFSMGHAADKRYYIECRKIR